MGMHGRAHTHTHTHKEYRNSAINLKEKLPIHSQWLQFEDLNLTRIPSVL